MQGGDVMVCVHGLRMGVLMGRGGKWDPHKLLGVGRRRVREIHGVCCCGGNGVEKDEVVGGGM